MIAIVRVRGGIRVQTDIVDTMKMLKLYKQNYAVVYEKTPSLLGMLSKAKDYTTWGEINDETRKLLKGEGYFRLNPPRGGYGRKGIKKGFSEGGALGYRGEKINDLIKKMVK
jgi:large subunit ribosomal protein L30